MPLLGPDEKRELEALVLAALRAHGEAGAGPDLLAAGTCVRLDAAGATLAAAPDPGALATVEVRTLFTALCHLSDGPAGPLPAESLDALAREAAAALAAVVNRYGPD